MVPEYTRKNASFPTNGSAMILNARAENGSSSEEWHIHALDSRDIGRSGHILKHCVQKLLHALVPVCASAAYRHGAALAGGLSKGGLHILYGRLLALQVLHHQIVVQIADFLDELAAVQLCVVLHIVRDVNDGDVLALVIIVDVGLHLKQVDDSLELVFLANRQLHADGVLAKSGLNLLYSSVEIRAQNVHLIDEGHSRYVVGVSLTPYVLRLRLYTTLRTEHAYGAVQYTKGTLYLNRKVNMARSIDDVDSMLQSAGLRLAVLLQGPVTGCSSGSDGDTTLLLLLHPVHGSSSLVGIADLIVYASVIQNTLGQCGLTSIDVSHDSDISGSLQWIFSSSHGIFLLK